jgi:hypothetical protein
MLSCLSHTQAFGLPSRMLRSTRQIALEKQSKLISDTTGWIIRTKAGKVVQTTIGVVSADGKTDTLTTAGVTADGRQLYNVAVYEKQ